MWFQENQLKKHSIVTLKYLKQPYSLFWNPLYSIPETLLINMLKSGCGTIRVLKNKSKHRKFDQVIQTDNKKEYILKAIILFSWVI